MSAYCFMQIIRILFYFGFSSKLALIIDVISRAQMDIILFTIMFFCILFSFALIGVVLFGTTNGSF